jgi:hypothetical protein
MIMGAEPSGSAPFLFFNLDGRMEAVRSIWHVFPPTYMVLFSLFPVAFWVVARFLLPLPPKWNY